MTKTAQIGTWDNIFGRHPAEVQAIATTLRDVIRRADPDAFEEARTGDNAYHFGAGPRKMADGYAYLMPQKDRINLGFYQGADLPDPDGLLEGTGKSLRHVKVRDLETAKGPQVADLITAAIAKKAAP